MVMKPGDNDYWPEKAPRERPKPSSALSKRPAPKLVDDSEGPSYILPGIQLSDPLTAGRKVFDGWRQDPEALLVVEGLAQGQGFAGSDFSGVDFSGASLSFIDLSGADLINANLAGVDLRGADLSGADLRGVNLESANLEGANLEGALLDGAYLKNAVIAGVKMAKKALNELEKMQQLQQQAEEGTLDLRRVNLKYLDLRRLDLRGVDLTGVDLSGVNLVGVNLSGAKVDPMYLDGTYAFRQMPGRRLDIREGNLAGADLTTVNQLRARKEELDILRQKRLDARAAGERAAEEQARAEEERHRRAAEEQAVFPSAHRETRAEPDMPAACAGYAEPATPAAEASPKSFDEELELLKARRQQQPSREEMRAHLTDVVLETPDAGKRPRSVVTRRPRRKEMLPPSKYDFPVLYRDPEETAAKPGRAAATIREVSKVAEQVTYHVKKAFRKIMPRRSRVRRQRQRS